MALLTANDLSILLVEPSAMQLKLIMRHLHEEGVHKIDGVSSGKEALDFIDKYPPDLVVTAMYLPDMTANELIETVIHKHPQLNMSYMLISSEKGHAALEPVRQAGVIAILPKPFDHKDLQRAIRATLDIIDPEEITLESYDVSELSLLVVDDSLTSRNHIMRIFSTMGILHIDDAENGRKALDKINENHYDLIVTDLNMPEMDGHELVQYIRNDMGNDAIPIMILTTENNEARLGQVEQAGVSAILNKPFEPHTIREMLYRLLDS